MPFAKTTDIHTEEYWSEHYNSFLQPILGDLGNISVHRSSPMRGDILKEIIKDLINSDIVVADITDSNPNVFWELGVRQSFNHGTITIAEEGTRLPFDISSKGTLFYSIKNHLKTKKFIKDFKMAVKDCIKNPNRPDSTILEEISGRGTIQEISRKEEIMGRIEALKSEYEDNYSKLSSAITEMRKNQRKKKPGSSIITERLRKASIELLITNRYLSANDNLYMLGEEYFDNLQTINGQLVIWESAADSTEKFCINQVLN